MLSKNSDHSITITKIDLNDTLTEVTIQCTDDADRIHTLKAIINPCTFPKSLPQFKVDLPSDGKEDEDVFIPEWRSTASLFAAAAAAASS
eukprot:7553232-Ditylum_brightwellii.AAC.1